MVGIVAAMTLQLPGCMCDCAPKDWHGAGRDTAENAVDSTTAVDSGAHDSGDTGTPPAGVVVLHGGSVFDTRGSPAFIAEDVWLDGATIYAVTTASPPSDATIIDVTGKFLTPGLVDSHVHLSESGATVWTGDPVEQNLRADLYHGVTAVYDLGGPTSLFAFRDAVDAGTLLGPRIHATGPFLTAVGSHPCESVPDPDLCTFVASDADASEQIGAAGDAVSTRLDGGADGIKVALADASFTPWPTTRLDLGALADITAAAASAGALTFAHVDENVDAIDALGAGVDVLAHPVFAGPLSDEALGMMAGVPVETTVGAFAAVGDVLDGTTDLSDPGLIVGPGVLDNWAYVKAHPDVLVAGWADDSAGWATAAKGNLPLLRAAGAVVLPGSDAGYYFVAHGSGLHAELAAMVADGWTPTEALVAATETASDTLGFPGGRLDAGRPADLLILNRDPTGDVTALDDIDRVVREGAIYDREALRTVDLVTRPTDGSPVDLGGACLTDADCAADDACDGLTHACAPACPTPWGYADVCGSDAYCMAEDALVSPVGVCHDAPGLNVAASTDSGADCDLYAQNCTPTAYELACVPFDGNTNGCWESGPRSAGQSCSWDDASLACGVGLYCSLLDYRCYTLCDPAAPNTCPGTQRCAQQFSAPGVPWFGVCL